VPHTPALLGDLSANINTNYIVLIIYSAFDEGQSNPIQPDKLALPPAFTLTPEYLRTRYLWPILHRPITIISIILRAAVWIEVPALSIRETRAGLDARTDLSSLLDRQRS